MSNISLRDLIEARDVLNSLTNLDWRNIKVDEIINLKARAGAVGRQISKVIPDIAIEVKEDK